MFVVVVFVVVVVVFVVVVFDVVVFVVRSGIELPGQLKTYSQYKKHSEVNIKNLIDKTIGMYAVRMVPAAMLHFLCLSLTLSGSLSISNTVQIIIDLDIKSMFSTVNVYGGKHRRLQFFISEGFQLHYTAESLHWVTRW